MMTPQQIEQISFSRATFGGYDMQSVDAVLEPLTEDYLNLYKENALLKSKMRVLVAKLEEYRKAAVDAVRKLSQDVGIPSDLKEIVNPDDIPFLAESAYADACRPGNPKDTSVEDITALYKSLL